jgi:hypothetical protein
LQAIFRRAEDPRLQAIVRELRVEYVAEDTHHTLHRIVNNALGRNELFPGSQKDTYSNAEVEKAIEVLIKTYRQEGVPDYAEHLEGFLEALRAAGMLG